MSYQKLFLGLSQILLVFFLDSAENKQDPIPVTSKRVFVGFRWLFISFLEAK